MSDGAPELSVLTPSYGYGRFIEDALVSTQRQENLRIEHVVQDGGSRDETIQILDKFPGVIWSSEPDRGQAEALNRAYEHSSSDWIGWLNADEFYLPVGLEEALALARETGADVVFADCAFVDEGGHFIRLLPQHRFSGFLLRWYGPFIASCSTIFRRAALGNHPFDESIHRVLDWDLYLRLWHQGARFAYLPQPLGAFRVHPDRITAQPSRDFAESHLRLRLRHALPWNPLARRLGRGVHGFKKLVAGSYLRQAKAARFRGMDFRWFTSNEAAQAVRQFLSHVYRIG
jgi:glycosyltransferase involved in cell wall biosynthesis